MVENKIKEYAKYGLCIIMLGVPIYSICDTLFKKPKIEEREIITGKSNKDFIIVEEGLDEGEKVLLRDPTQIENLASKIKKVPLPNY